ncbi:MAG: tetratricopeptide repeat protein [Treponema sp.]|nr:tetratricopeptide repeat protein [Treponema sp.]
MDSQSAQALAKAHELIEQGDCVQAKTILEDALPADLENEDLSNAIGFCAFWNENLEDMEKLTALEQGELLISQWNRFIVLVNQYLNPSELTLYAFKKGIYTKALNKFLEADDEGDNKMRAELFRKTGLCKKRLGDYEEALDLLNRANSEFPGQAVILAERADCYDLCGEAKLAKILFREAFFQDSEAIDLDNLDSPLIRGLIERVQKHGYSGRVLHEWIGAYGILLGVFNIKRPLSSQEIGKLKQEIFAKESENKDPANEREVIVPRLMNLYLWLLDYYLLSKESMNKINELLLKIKLLNPDIYKEYFNFNVQKSR